MTKELKTAISIIKKTNRILKRKFQRNGTAVLKYKDQTEIVTKVDMEINEYIIKEIKKVFPSHNIVSEEADKIDNRSDSTWYVDPIDGTSNFSYGFPEFATCLGFAKNNNLQLGVIGLPQIGDVCYAEKTAGAKCNGKKIKVSGVSSLDKSMLLVCRGHAEKSRLMFVEFFEKIKMRRCRLRMFNSAGIELSAVANGQADGCVLAGIKDWDVAAGVVLIREAGGKATNFKGEDWKQGDDTIVASNGLIHNELIELTKNIS